MPSELSDKPNLRRLRDIARSLQRDCRAGDPAAQARMRMVFPGADTAQATLSKAQTVVAREHGFASWPRLKAEVDARDSARATTPLRRNAPPIYDGKAKTLYEGAEPGTLIQYFKDDATAFDGAKAAVLEGKGVLNSRISAFVMTRLAGIGVETHFIEQINPREQLIRAVEVVPLEVVCRNIVAGSLSRRFGVPEGQPLARAVVEFYLKDDALHDPLVAPAHIAAFDLASPREVDEMTVLALRVNDDLKAMFAAAGITLVDFKLEFGRLWENGVSRIILADEISPDCCRLWDRATGEKLDKDRFRRDLGDVVEGYAEVARRLGVGP